ncbi:AmmeMemoRadiSam system protein B [bacterium]
MKYFRIPLCWLFIMNFGCNLNAKRVREPNVAGAFYPSDKKQLSSMIDKVMNVNIPWTYYTDKRLLGVISPHAGYIYSGPVAGYVYKLIGNFNFKTVVIIGPSHYVYLNGLVSDDNDFWRTPLGEVEIDKDVQDFLLKNNSSIRMYPKAFDQEHCLEVQVPFLQRSLKNFKIVPLLMGAYDSSVCESLADTFYKLTKNRDDILILISSDLSHFKTYDVAYKMDNNLIQDLVMGRTDKFLGNINTGVYEACGGGPMGVLLHLSDKYGLKNNKLNLKYLNSGDTAGDKGRVVGYTAVVMYKDPIKNKAEAPFKLTDREKKQALKIARQSIHDYLTKSEQKDFSKEKLDKIFYEEYGAFVTLHKNKALRGCIGNMIGKKALWKTIRDMALASAFEDPRFPSLSMEEFKDIEIEISILSPLKVIKDPDEIILGTHGVIVKKGFYQGVFLPQVATETGWSKEEFMGHLCRDKAGLKWDAWKDEDVEISIFSATVFSE